MEIKRGDIIRLFDDDNTYEIADIIGDNVVLLDGAIPLTLSRLEIEVVLNEEMIADMLIDRMLSD